ncbi:GH36-type glycosyl hydrolase domain-containing protein [Gilvimarinus xylanilyticus]|uniref:Uncharacterized protein n=1 Tax=Gilvimarinus xylanilyticus TaxID=2944139 RepID=A0A9X2KV75_9GAMM|nr:hypothetical protein [Gilvimarinus xylanilyticus]MCP8900643.1 hypothetical protein [Gilvimarinus xylanilyticus]
MIYSSNYGARWHLSDSRALPRAYGQLIDKRQRMVISAQGEITTTGIDDEQSAHLIRRFYLTEADQQDATVLPWGENQTEPALFDFSVGDGALIWDSCINDIDARLVVTLEHKESLELWSLTLANRSATTRRLALYPVFSFATHASTNNAAEYRPDLEGIVARSVVSRRVRDNSDCSIKQQFVLHETPPRAWQCQTETFLGASSWSRPQALQQTELDCDESRQWATPLAAFQYDIELAPGASKTLRFMVGQNNSKSAIVKWRDTYLSAAGFSRVLTDNQTYHRDSRQSIQLESPETELNHFTNRWLALQVLSAHPKGLRDKLATNTPLVFVEPAKARSNILNLLSTSDFNPATLTSGYAQCCAELIILLEAYCNETGDLALLRELISIRGKRISVFERLNRIVYSLAEQIDDRGLLDTRRGDEDGANWRSLRACTSATFAGAYALQQWAKLCENVMLLNSLAHEYRQHAQRLHEGAQEYLWDGSWFACGLSVRGKRLGGCANQEGQIHLKPQAWALLAGSQLHQPKLLRAVDNNLKTEHGLLNLWPAYTKLDDDTATWLRWQPGTGLNASHLASDAAQYAYALYQVGESERAFEVLHSIIPCLDSDQSGSEKVKRWGVLPTYLADYVTGPADGDLTWAGRASQKPSQFACGWVYLALERGLLGLKGSEDKIEIKPQLPMAWYGVKAVKNIRGAVLYISIERDHSLAQSEMRIDGVLQEELMLEGLEPGRRYQIDIALSKSKVRQFTAPTLAAVEV